MNKCQIQKLILIFLTFPYILIFPSDVFPSSLDNILSRNKINKFKKQGNSQKLKIYKVNILLTNLKRIQKNNYDVNFQENIDKDSKSFINEILIESKVQSEINNVLYAEDEVIVRFKDNILKADSFSYDKKTKFAKAEGNIQLKINNQIFQADIVEYDFVKKKGNFKNVKGLINSDSIISDFDFTSKSIYKNFLSNIQRIEKDKVEFTPDKVSNWIFSADCLKVDQDKWSSEQAYLTNDLLETNQIKLQFNQLKIYPRKDKLLFKSKKNNLIFQDKITIPFWIGDRTISKKSENVFAFQNRLNIGYDKLNKDGFYIGRKLNSIKLKNDLFLNIEPQFLLQRTLEGKTKSFVQKNYSINSPRVERNISLSDYFALSSFIEGKIKNWDLIITKELNSFDVEKFANSLRTRAELSKEINLFNRTFVHRIFGAYREPIWNGSAGESEIYNAYGWKLDQEQFVKNDLVVKNQIISFALGNYKAEELNSSDFAESFKGSVTYQLKQSFPVYEKKIGASHINRSFEYIPEPIKQGTFINSKIYVNYNLYKDGNSQKYLGVGLGPEIILGNFKKDFFDYTRISIFPFYKFKSGKSIFKFDQIAEKLIVNLDFDQQIIGSWLIETKGILNLDNNSNDYGKFIYSKIGMNFKKRSYSFGVFYQPHNQAGGINFTLNGFK